MTGKGDERRPTDEKKVRKNWPFEKPENVLKKHRAHTARQDRMVRGNELQNRGAV